MERKYQMITLSRGDYLLPSNDGETLWRLSQYLEDGNAEYSPDGKTWRELRGKFWMTTRCRLPLRQAIEKMDEYFLDDWNNWDTYETLLRSRKLAIEAALTADERIAAQRER